MDQLEIDTEKTREVLARFITDQTHGAGFENLVLGLSGGVDSATVAFLASEAVGKQHVTAVFMPYSTTSTDAAADAEMVASAAGINLLTISIFFECSSQITRRII